MNKYKCTLTLSYTVEASDADEARNKVDWLINEEMDDIKPKIKVLKIKEGF